MVLIFMVILGAITAAIAHAKGRNAVGWFFVGFFFGLLGLIVAFVVSDVGAERAARDSIRSDNRRLREQLRQEKLKNQRFREHALRRIDAHDRHLGLDTRRNELAGPSAYRYLGTEEPTARETRTSREPRDRGRRPNEGERTLDLAFEDEDDPNEPRQLYWT